MDLFPPLGACAHFGACADHGVGVFMLRPRAKNRADVRPPCEKTYLHRALESSRVLEAHSNIFNLELHQPTVIMAKQLLL